MTQEIILNILLLIYLLLILKEDSLKSEIISFNAIRKYLNTLSVRQICLFLIGLVSIVALLVMKGDRNLFVIYIYTSLSILIIFHAQWLSQKLEIKYKVLLFFLAAGVIFFRIFYATVISHDIFIILVVVWLGPFINSLRFYSTKIFVYISLIWFFYDIYYIWVTAGYRFVTTVEKAAGFPLSLTINQASIGLADLFYASLLLSIIKRLRYQLLAIALLIGSNLALTYYVYKVQFLDIFPLLILWVPSGLSVLFFDYRSSG